MRPSHLALALSALAVHVALVGCSRALELRSQWRVQPVIVDGADDDWGLARYVLDEAGLTIGVANDANYLYLCAVTGQRDLQVQVATRGLDLWLDPKGGKRTFLGLHLTGVDRGEMGGERRHRHGGGEGARPPVDPEHLARLFARMEAQREVRVLAGERDVGRATVPGRDDPLQARLHYDQGRLVYEARVPLVHDGHPAYRVDAASEAQVGLALKVPSLAAMLGAGPSRGGDGFPDDDGPGSGHAAGERHPGGMGTLGGPSGGLPIAAALEQWVRVRLAAAP